MTLQDIYTDIENLSEVEGLDVSIIGLSTFGNPIYAIHVGEYDADQMIVEGAIHAREWVVAPLLIEMAKYYNGQQLDYGIYFIPVSNPDGVKIALEGVGWLDVDVQEFLLQVNPNQNDFTLWKANANAVDVNVNFDALWGGGAQNITYPSSENFIGYYPNSEVETNVLIDFTNKINPVLTLSYHTKGEVIYWGFEVLNEDELNRDDFIVEKLSQTTGYPAIKTVNSTGGYSDWVSQNLRVPAYTIEVGNENINHPIPLSKLNIIFEQNKLVPSVAYSGLIEYNLINNIM